MAKVKDLQTEFKEKLAPELQKKLELKNVNAVPKLEKVTVNVGFGSLINSGNKDFEFIIDNIASIAGQKPVVKEAKKSISNFKLREGSKIGTAVTIRGKKMYDFVNKLINIVFPRVRDFRGISKKAFDGNGNYSIGFKEHTVFPEISPDDVIKFHGVQISITTSAIDDEQGLALLEAFGFPFKK
ncbi:50S ribosomal protein L5 [Candidatus Peregrinibacteria bacterium]|jgi:large subunit ribosomal protein L5|nr:50S ribosomal protein L5 [Candidatus Peregrinibacteria bacterium]MBT6401824.1 50S ribosomal protein L5 [candidate division WWE3 bacterium]MBT7736195.1 50S ribosomal protein L5 [Candidatus Peregrinibacteria bacterium]